MNVSIEKVCAISLLASSLLVAFVPWTYEKSDEFSAPKKILSFLNEVVGLDLTRYNATLVSNVEIWPSDYGDLVEVSGTYIFESSESKIDVGYTFINETLAWCNLYMLRGSPLFAQPSPANVLDAAKVFLQRYQNYSRASYIQTMLNILESIDEIKPTNITLGNVKLEISNKGQFTHFIWVYTSNGIEFSRKKVSFAFQGTMFAGIMDVWYLYRIGSDVVNVSEDEAVGIAREALKDIPPCICGRVMRL